MHTDLQQIHQLIESSADFSEFLDNPVIPKGKQDEIILEIFEKKVSAMTLKYLQFLIQKGRLSVLKGICEAFDRLFLETKNIAKVEVFSSVSLNETQLTAMKKHLKDKLHKDVQTHLVIEPNIIGGVKVRIGDEILDYTIQTQLEEFRQNFLRTF